MPANVRWFGPAVLSAMHLRAARNLKAAGKFLGNAIRNDLQRVKFPPASAPGEVPHYRSQDLARSITSELDASGLICRVGPAHTVKYGVFLELGTARMEPRPFLRPALLRNRSALLKIIGRP